MIAIRAFLYLDISVVTGVALNHSLNQHQVLDFSPVHLC